jgi:hypothetical protein
MCQRSCFRPRRRPIRRIRTPRVPATDGPRRSRVRSARCARPTCQRAGPRGSRRRANRRATARGGRGHSGVAGLHRSVGTGLSCIIRRACARPARS